MINFVSYLTAFMVTFPIIFTVVIYIIGLKFYKHKRKALHIALDSTTIFYLIAVVLLFHMLFNHNIIGIVLIIFISLLIILIIYQWKKKTEVQAIKAIRLLWRLCFVIFFLFYILLVFLGIMSRMI